MLPALLLGFSVGNIYQIANNIIEKSKYRTIKLLDLEKLIIQYAKEELALPKMRAETKSNNPGDFEKKESIKSLDTLINSILNLTISIPTRPEAWGYFFFLFRKNLYFQKCCRKV